MRVDELRLEEAERIAQDPAVLGTLEDDIASDARGALLLLAVRCIVVAAIGGALGAFVAAPGSAPALVGGLVGAAGRNVDR